MLTTTHKDDGIELTTSNGALFGNIRFKLMGNDNVKHWFFEDSEFCKHPIMRLSLKAAEYDALAIFEELKEERAQDILKKQNEIDRAQSCIDALEMLNKHYE